MNWTEIYTNNYKNVKSVCAKIIGYHHFFLEDCVSKTFERGMEKEYQFNSELSSINTWLCTIAKNYCFLQLEQDKKNLPILIDFTYENDEIESDENIYLKNKISELVLNEPDSKNKQAFEYIFSGMSYKQLSEKINVNEITLRARVKRFMDLLRKKLDVKTPKNGKNFGKLSKLEYKKTTTIESRIYRKGNIFFVWDKKAKKYIYTRTLEEAQKIKQETK